MKLIDLTTTNFMPFKGRMSIEFPQDPIRNVMLVFGDNMRGKTSLLNALRWVFYGKAVGRNSRELPLQDLVNTEAIAEGDWSIEACVTFEANGEQYELRRIANRAKLVSRPTRPEDFEVIRGLKRNGMVIPDHAIDAEINRFVPEQTSRFFLFDGELLQEYESLLIDNSDQGRLIKDSIEQALGVPTLIRGREDAQTLLKEAQRQQTKDLEKIHGLERHIRRQAELQAKVDAYERDLESLEINLKQTRDERSLIDSFVQATERIHIAKERLSSKQELLKQGVERKEENAARRLDLMKTVWRDIIRPQVESKRSYLQTEADRISNLLLKEARAKAEIAQREKSLFQHVCEACGQDLSESHRQKIMGEIEALVKELSGIQVDEQSRNGISAEIFALEKLLAHGPAAEILRCESEIARISVDCTRLENEIERLHDQIKGSDTNEIRQMREKGERLAREEGRLEQQIRDVKVEIEKVQRDIGMISKAIERTPDAKGRRSTLLVKLVAELEQIYGASVDRLRENLKDQVEISATAAFKQLTTQKKYAGLRINSNYGLSILDENSQEVAIRSAGAEQIVALSLIDGLSRAGRSAGPVVMDTPFGRLDPKHRANILTYLPQASEQLVLLVHDGEINRHQDLGVIGSRIGAVYEIDEVTSRHSTLRKVTNAYQ